MSPEREAFATQTPQTFAWTSGSEGGGVLNIDNSLWDYGDAEVWAVFADSAGQLMRSDWAGEDRNYCFRFRAEGHWYYSGGVSQEDACP